MFSEHTFNLLKRHCFTILPIIMLFWSFIYDWIMFQCLYAGSIFEYLMKASNLIMVAHTTISLKGENNIITAVTHVAYDYVPMQRLALVVSIISYFPIQQSDILRYCAWLCSYPSRIAKYISWFSFIVSAVSFYWWR